MFPARALYGDQFTLSIYLINHIFMLTVTSDLIKLYDCNSISTFSENKNGQPSVTETCAQNDRVFAYSSKQQNASWFEKLFLPFFNHKQLTDYLQITAVN